MTDQDSSYYRPRSPDFSSLQSSFPFPSTSSFNFNEPRSSHSHFSFNFSPNNHLHTPLTPSYPLPSPLAHRASYDASPFFSPQYQRSVPSPGRVSQQYIPPFTPPVDLDPDMTRRSARLSSRAAAADVVPFAPGPGPGHVPAPAPATASISAPLSTPVSELNYNQPIAFPFTPQAASAPVPVSVPAAAPAPAPVPSTPASAPPKEQPSNSLPVGIEVKTKFPVARIKRIMQADEDVGKVAQVTPIAVAKALELFMISLVTKAAREAKDRNSKRVTALHLKQAVAKDEVLDFLAEIIDKVPDHSAGGSGRKHEDDGSDHNEGRGKKRGGRRPKEPKEDSD